MQNPSIDPNKLVVETFETEDPAVDPAQIQIVETGCVMPCDPQPYMIGL